MPPKPRQNSDDFVSAVRAGFQHCGVDYRQPLLLAVSGGADSMALLSAAARLGIPHCSVAYVDHALRPESAADGEFVAEAAHAAGFDFCLLAIEKGALERLHSGSLEEAARKERYRLLAELAESKGIPVVATAHHFDDQAETVLHNITRGTGLRGLRGMPSERSLAAEVRLVRPMLSVSREQIEAYLVANGLLHRLDASNASEIHTRNRLRRQILPQLRESVNSAADRHLVELADQAQELLTGLDELSGRILAEAILDQSADACRVSRSVLQQWPEVIVRHVIANLWIRLNWPRRRLTRHHYHQLATMVVSGDPTKSDLPGKVIVEVDGDLLRLRVRSGD